MFGFGRRFEFWEPSGASPCTRLEDRDGFIYNCKYAKFQAIRWCCCRDIKGRCYIEGGWERGGCEKVVGSRKIDY